MKKFIKTLTSLVVLLVLSLLVVSCGKRNDQTQKEPQDNPIVDNSVKITFNTNGGNSINELDTKKDLEVTLTNPEKENNRFDGWYTNNTLTTKVILTSNNKYVVDKSTTLYAKWVEQTTLSLNTGNENDSLIVLKGDINREIELPTSKRENNTFIGWFTDDTLSSEVLLTNQKYRVEKTTTLYAKFAKNVVLTLNYNNKNNTPNDTISTYEGFKYSNDTIPTYEGYTFKHWSLSTDSTNSKVDFPLTISNTNMQLVAQWDSNEYTISFKIVQDATIIIPNQIIKHGNLITRPSNTFEKDMPEKGLTFKYWAQSTSLSEKFDFNTPVTKDIELIAQYELKQYSVMFQFDNGDPVKIVNVGHGNLVEKPVTPTSNSGKTFLGWQLNGKAFDFNTPITNTTILKATWSS